MSYESLFANQVQTLLVEQDTVIFDLRDAQSFAHGHMENAQAPTEENIDRLIREKHKDTSILVYCYHGINSRDFCHFLSMRGFRKVYNLEGGWVTWSSQVNSLEEDVSDELGHWLGMSGFEQKIFNPAS